MTVPLSVAMVCKNNADTVPRVLESVNGLASEFIAVDSGSTDGTLELLRGHGVRVIETEWRGYVATKQIAIDACDQPWTLLLDSDESPDEELRRRIAEAIERNNTAIDGYEVNRMTWYAGRPLRHVWQPEWRLRLFRTGKGRQTGSDPHDRVELVPSAKGRVERLGGSLRHDSFRTIADHLRTQWGHAKLGAESLHERGRGTGPARLLVSPAGAMIKQLVLKGGWRDGWRGWAASGSAAAGTLMKHVMLMELGRSRGRPDA